MQLKRVCCSTAGRGRSEMKPEKVGTNGETMSSEPLRAGGGDEPSSRSPGELATSEVFRLLGNRRRLEVLRYVDARGTTVTLDELARHVAARENGIEVGQLSSNQRKRAYIALYQNHLPTLDRVGVVAYDRRSGTVTPAALSQFQPYLSVREPRVRPPLLAVVVLVIVGLVAVGLLGVGSAGFVPIWLWLGLGLVAIATVVGLFRYTVDA